MFLLWKGDHVLEPAKRILCVDDEADVLKNMIQMYGQPKFADDKLVIYKTSP